MKISSGSRFKSANFGGFAVLRNPIIDPLNIADGFICAFYGRSFVDFAEARLKVRVLESFQ